MILVSFTFVIGILTLFVHFRHGPLSLDSTMALSQIMGDKIMFVVAISTNHGTNSLVL